MNVLRINLHIRKDGCQQLFTELLELPPKPRAERLRHLATLGLKNEMCTTAITSHNLNKHDNDNLTAEQTEPNKNSRDFTSDLQTMLNNLS